MVTFDKLNAVL